MTTQWDDRASFYQADFEAAPIRTRVARDIVAHAVCLQPRAIVDAGGGQGHLAFQIKEALPAAFITIVDNSRNMLVSARQRLAGTPGIALQQGGFEDLGAIASGTIDLFTSTFAFHHVDDETKRIALREARRVLRPGGRLIMADEIICDPALIGRPAELLAAMGRIFYPRLDLAELEEKFAGFVEFPTDLTTMAHMMMEAGFEASFRVLNRLVAVITAEPMVQSPDAN